MPTGSGKTQTAHGIAIQEVASPDTSAGVVILRVESQATEPTKPRTIKPQKNVIKPCNAKGKMELKVAVTHIQPDYNVDNSTSIILLGSYIYVENKVVPFNNRLCLHTIRMYHECEGRIEKYVPRITVWHHEACRVITNGDSKGRIFLSYPHMNNGFFFLLTTVFIHFKKSFQNCLNTLRCNFT